MKDYYKILGVDKSATQEQLKSAYRAKAKEHHPDKGGDAEVFKSINEAYETLSDSNKRSQYDNPNPFGNFSGGGNPFGQGSPFGFDFGDIFSQFNSGNFRQEFREDLDIRVSVEIQFKSIYQDKPLEVSYYKYVPCTKCNYTGVEDSSDSDECLHCDGKGHSTNRTGQRKSCEYCHGSGKIHTKQCSHCDGKKVESKFETLTLDNVFMLGEEAQKLVYRGSGHFSRYYPGKTGSLVIQLIPIVDRKYVRSGANLIYELDIDYKIAIEGGEIEYTHLDDKTYKVKIPAKSNKGSRLKMGGKGLLHRDKQHRGDLIFDICIVIKYEE